MGKPDLVTRYEDILEFVTTAQLRPEVPVIQKRISASRIVVDQNEFDTFASNDYLGVSTHPRVRASIVEYLLQPESSIGACRTQILGALDIFKTVGKSLGTFVGLDDALIFSSAYLASWGCVRALADTFPYHRRQITVSVPSSNKKSVIIGDALNHASLIDASESARSTFVTFRHNNMAHLEELLSRYASEHSILVIVDGVYSMDGEIAPLVEISRLARKYDALLMVDDSHGFGVLGRDGRGVAEMLGVEVDIYLASFTKACGGAGGFIAASSTVIEYLRWVARTFIFSDPMPPLFVSALPTMLDIFASPEGARLRETVLSRAEYLRTSLRKIGFTILGEGTPIVPLLIGDSKRAEIFARTLTEKHDISILPIITPAVSSSLARLRFCLTAYHSLEQIEHLIDCCSVVGRELGLVT